MRSSNRRGVPEAQPPIGPLDRSGPLRSFSGGSRSRRVQRPHTHGAAAGLSKSLWTPPPVCLRCPRNIYPGIVVLLGEAPQADDDEQQMSGHVADLLAVLPSRRPPGRSRRRHAWDRQWRRSRGAADRLASRRSSPEPPARPAGIRTSASVRCECPMLQSSWDLLLRVRGSLPRPILPQGGIPTFTIPPIAGQSVGRVCSARFDKQTVAPPRPKRCHFFVLHPVSRPAAKGPSLEMGREGLAISPPKSLECIAFVGA